MHREQSTAHSLGQQLTTKMSFGRRQLRCMPTLNLFQMKWMQVICNMKNVMNTEFEHGEEL
jgi:Uri superfamily endonuclease